MTDPMQRYARVALLLALATVIHTAEAMLPVTAVWFRFGFANIVGLATLCLFGFRDALIVTLGRIFLGSLLSGLFGSPAFILSFTGGVCAIVGMGLAYRITNDLFSEIGLSVIGALLHNLGQLCAAYFILIGNEAIFLLLPFMMSAATGTGIVNGLAARFFIARFRRLSSNQSAR